MKSMQKVEGNYPSWLDRLRSLVLRPSTRLSKNARREIMECLEDIETIHNCEKCLRSHRITDPKLLSDADKLRGKLLFRLVDIVHRSGLLLNST